MARIEVLDYSIPAPAYIAVIKMAKANPSAIFKQTLHHWASGTGQEIMRQYRRDLHRRINERGGIEPIFSRVSLHDWAMIATPRVVLERHTIRNMNRHQRPRFFGRQREEWA